jgi:hypothetical protein
LKLVHFSTHLYQNFWVILKYYFSPLHRHAEFCSSITVSVPLVDHPLSSLWFGTKPRSLRVQRKPVWQQCWRSCHSLTSRARSKVDLLLLCTVWRRYPAYDSSTDFLVRETSAIFRLKWIEILSLLSTTHPLPIIFERDRLTAFTTRHAVGLSQSISGVYVPDFWLTE